jgi:protein AFG1
MAAQHFVTQQPLSIGPVTETYERMVDAGEVQRDEAQVTLAAKLDALHDSLALLPPVPVGSDKSIASSTTSNSPLPLGRSLVSAQFSLRN